MVNAIKDHYNFVVAQPLVNDGFVKYYVGYYVMGLHDICYTFNVNSNYNYT